MNQQPAVVRAPQPDRFMVYFGLVVVIGVVVYFGFMAVDGTGLQNETGSATMLDKEYRPPGTTYVTQKIGNRTQTLPQTTPGMYVLKLDLGGQQTECAVDKSLYDAVDSEDRVSVVYQKRRITGGLQVVRVTLGEQHVERGGE